MVISFPSVPVATKLDTVVVVAAVNLTVFGAFMVKVAKVSDVLNVVIPVPATIVRLLNASPPPSNEEALAPV